jgi:hypothetical protein
MALRKGAQPALFDTGTPEPTAVLIDQFKEAYIREYRLPYATRPADFVSLTRLYKSLGRSVVSDRWGLAVENYFTTPQGTHTLGDLAMRFATFQRTSLDRYGKPAQTRGEERFARNKAALEQFLGGD